jgi:hypothetical protein
MAERKRFLLDEIQNQRNPAGVAIPLYADGGLNVRPRTHALGLSFQGTDPAFWNVDFEDFTMRYAAADWTITKIGTGTNALAAGAGGVLSVVNSGASGDSEAFQRTVAAFQPDVCQPFCASFRFQVDDITNADVAFGLQKANTTPFTDPSDGVWFKKAAATTFNFNVAKASAQTTVAAVAAPVVNTYMSLELAYDGVFVYYGVNGAIQGTVVATNLPNTVALSPTFAVRNNSAAARTMLVDYIMAGQYRG